jgi:hypothetical protein
MRPGESRRHRCGRRGELEVLKTTTLSDTDSLDSLVTELYLSLFKRAVRDATLAARVLDARLLRSTTFLWPMNSLGRYLGRNEK